MGWPAGGRRLLCKSLRASACATRDLAAHGLGFRWQEDGTARASGRLRNALANNNDGRNRYIHWQLPDVKRSLVRRGKAAQPDMLADIHSRPEVAVATTEPCKQPYVAEDSDLDDFFRSTPVTVHEEV